MKKIAIVFCVAALFAASASAEDLNPTLISDDFTSDLDGWYLTSNSAPEGTSKTLETSVIGTGNALSVNALQLTDDKRHISSNMDKVDIHAVGDKITLTFDFEITSVGGAKTGNKEDFRFGLYYDNATVLTADEVWTDATLYTTDDDPGYFVRMSTGDTIDTSLCSDGGTLGSLLGGNDMFHTINDAFMPGLVTGIAYHAEFTIEHIVNHALGLSLLVTDSNSTTIVDNYGTTDVDTLNGPYATFNYNEVAFGEYDDDIEFKIDNVLVVAELIPEPATVALLGLGGLLLRRRKK